MFGLRKVFKPQKNIENILKKIRNSGIDKIDRVVSNDLYECLLDIKIILKSLLLDEDKIILIDFIIQMHIEMINDFINYCNLNYKLQYKKYQKQKFNNDILELKNKLENIKEKTIVLLNILKGLSDGEISKEMLLDKIEEQLKSNEQLDQESIDSLMSLLGKINEEDEEYLKEFENEINKIIDNDNSKNEEVSKL